MTSEPGPQPEPTIEPGEPAPGGPDSADAMDDGVDASETVSTATEPPAGRDLDPAKNPAVEDAAPDEVTEPEEKQQEGEKSDAAAGDDESDEAEPPA